MRWGWLKPVRAPADGSRPSGPPRKAAPEPPPLSFEQVAGLASGLPPVPLPDHELRVAAAELADALQPILASYRSTSDGVVTREQVQRTWAAYDAVRRLLR